MSRRFGTVAYTQDLARRRAEANKKSLRGSEQWLHQTLTELLGFDAEDLVEYVHAMDEPDAIIGYLSELLQRDPDDEIRAVATELLLRKASSRGDAEAKQKLAQAQVGDGVRVYVKKKQGRDRGSRSKKRGKRGRSRSPDPMAPSGHGSGSGSPEPPQNSNRIRGSHPSMRATTTTSRRGGKQRTGSPSTSTGVGGLGELSAKLSSRVVAGIDTCDCQARRHTLLTNCLACGKIICEQEGWGPCSFCGNMVGSKRQIKRDQSKVRNREKEAAQRRAKAYEEALARKERLLAFDREAAKRSIVIDDQADYYSHDNVWLDASERAVAREREAAREDAAKRAQERKHRITFDFAGRRVLVAEPSAASGGGAPGDHDPHALAPLTPLAPRFHARNNADALIGTFRNPTLDRAPPVFVPTSGADTAGVRTVAVVEDPGAPGTPTRDSAAAKVASLADPAAFPALQHDDHFPMDMRNPNLMPTLSCTAPAWATAEDDGGVLGLPDRGVCLSMHQPWASLLVAGIKKVEGRTWPTDHRGRLWIASAALEPDEETIAAVEAQYAATQTPFPSSYPVSTLLGCVEVVDCLDNETYAESFPQTDLELEDNDSPFVFVCKNPRKLVVPVSISGDHKIWSLPSEVHAAVKTGLLPPSSASSAPSQ